MSGSSDDTPKRTSSQGGLTGGRPKRTRREYREFDVAEAWDNFAAAEQDGDHDDHSAQCRAVIFVDSADFDSDPEGYEGQTGNGHGHAEMDALDFLIGSMGAQAVEAVLQEGSVTLDCVGKPCCVQCSTMLGLLNIGPKTPATKKSRNTMLAGGAWSVSLRLKTFLVEKWKLKESDIQDFAAMDQSRFDRTL